MTQRMFHGTLSASALADQLAARFNDRFHPTMLTQGDGTALIQIGSKHATPVTVHIADTAGELRKENIVPAIWDAINDLCSLSRSLAGEKNAPQNPKVCLYCQVANPAEEESCQACGAALPVDLPRVCPKCGRGHTSEALFCQACATRLVTG